MQIISRTSTRRRHFAGRRWMFFQTAAAYYRSCPWFFWMAGLFLAGVALGATSVGWLGEESGQELAAIAQLFWQKRTGQPAAGTFWSVFGSNSLWLFLLFLAGYCTIAWPLIALAPLFRGLGFGVMASLLLQQEGFSACRQIALLLPGTVLSAFLLFLACGWSMQQSRRLMQTVHQPAAPGLYQRHPAPDARSYLLRFLLLLAALAGVAAMESALFFLFGF